jgi:plasmid stabilization system protein ParE
MKVRWSKRALAQLRAARDRIQEDNPAAAKEFVEAAEALANLLGEFPRMGVRTDEEGVIMFPLVRYRYRFFYEVLREEEVRIIRVRHASQKQPR